MLSPNKRCRICGVLTTHSFSPCESCRSDIEYRPLQQCSLCGIDLAGSNDPCTTCRDSSVEKNLSGIFTLGNWQGALREWLSVYKYGGDIRMADYLAERLSEAATRKWPGIPIVPVPPRSARIKNDGFDPVGALADSMEKRGLVICRLLRRKGKTTQKGRTRSERLNPGALDYRMKKETDLSGMSFVILDDVTTTGATLEICGTVLVECGAESVFGLAVCRD